jgi:hypothetical protein
LAATDKAEKAIVFDLHGLDQAMANVVHHAVTRCELLRFGLPEAVVAGALDDADADAGGGGVERSALCGFFSYRSGDKLPCGYN